MSFWCWAVSITVATGAVRLQELPRPNLHVASMPEPRPGAVSGATVAVVGFYGPHNGTGSNSKVDTACNATFLSNFWTPAPLDHFAPPPPAPPHNFICSEAAYWACQWWPSHAQDFENLNGQQAFDRGRALLQSGPSPDPSFGGFGNEWRAMMAILHHKFFPGSELAHALLSTEDAFLIEHQEGYDTDSKWSDYCDGTGSNWLGLMLMLLRDELRHPGQDAGPESWTQFVACAYSPDGGHPGPCEAFWLHAVKLGASSLNQALPYRCPPKL